MKVINNKGYDENWFWWGFFFGVFALIIAISKPENRSVYDDYNTYSLLSSAAKAKSDEELEKLQKLKPYKDLLDSKLISQEDFDKKKEELLS